MPPKVIKPNTKGSNSKGTRKSYLNFSMIRNPLQTPRKTTKLHATFKQEEKIEQDIHSQIISARHEQRTRKVYEFCSGELKSILSYAFILESHKTDPSFQHSRSDRIIRSNYRSGKFPQQNLSNVGDQPASQKFSNPVIPKHSIQIDNYIHYYQNSSLMEDLSSIFHVPITEDRIEDPNKLFNQILNSFQEYSAIFYKPFQPFQKIRFPFIIPLLGISGRTTICQLLSLIFEVRILEVNISIENKKKQRESMMISSLSPDLFTDSYEETDPSTPYPLPDTKVITGNDDKTIVYSIVSFIQENPNTGIIICNFPQSKLQITLLEKALAAIPSTNPDSSPTKSKNSQFTISGLIFSSFVDVEIPDSHSPSSSSHPNQNNGNNNSNIIFKPKLIDPETGFVYRDDFYLPSILDMNGIKPYKFHVKKEKIISRLITTPSNSPFLTSTLQSFNYNINKSVSGILSFEAFCRKKYVTIIIEKAPNIIPILEKLDVFIMNLFKAHNKSLSDYMLPDNPLYSLFHPNDLIEPFFAHKAIFYWRKCLATFGKAISDQYNLIQTLSSKMETILASARNRLGLFISQPDKREEICKKYFPRIDFMTCSHRKFNSANDMDDDQRVQFFTEIWSEAMETRQKNFKKVHSVLENSGLIDLLLELRKAPQIVFNSLVRKIVYVQWFYQKFILNPEETDVLNFFLTLSLDSENEVPTYNFLTQLNKKSPIQKSEFQPKEPTDTILTQSQNIINVKHFDSISNTSNIISNTSNNQNSEKSNNLTEKNENIEKTIQTNSNNSVKYNVKIDPTIQSPRRKARLGVRSNSSPIVMANFQNNNNPRRRFLNRNSQNIEISVQKEPFELLKEKLPILKEKDIEIMLFDSESACNALGIPIYPQSIDFSDIINFAEHFFNYLKFNLNEPYLQEEIKTANNILQSFFTTYKEKEELLITMISKLEDELKRIVQKKFSTEMETFSSNFRSNSKPFLVYDVSFLDESIISLAQYSLSIKVPLICQELVPFDVIQKIANNIPKCLTANEFMNIVRNLSLPDKIVKNIELCLRIMECPELFNTKKFLKSFAQDEEEKSLIMKASE